jgi:hypothetical protein
MAAQLGKLAEVPGFPNVTILVLPFGMGCHPGLISGSFTILRFPLNGGNVESEPPVIYSESFTCALYLDKPHEVERYSRAFGEIWTNTLTTTRHGTVYSKQQRKCEMSKNLKGMDWRKSSYSNSQGNCLEVANWRAPDHGTAQGECALARKATTAVLVRDTTNRSGATLAVSAETWRALLAKVRAA